MKTVTEALARAALTGRTIDCPFSEAARHQANCVCMGTKKVMACRRCGGAGWDNQKNNVCGECRGNGALASPKT